MSFAERPDALGAVYVSLIGERSRIKRHVLVTFWYVT